MTQAVAIILAAGQSTRMKTKLAKVLHEVCGRPMLDYVLDACRAAGIGRMLVVVGYGREQLIERYRDCEDILFVEQAEQKGTGHAVMCCKGELADFAGDAAVLCGDGPLIRGQTLRRLLDEHQSQGNCLTLATTVLDEPKGYGRIVRDSSGAITGIVEENDCTEQQRKIKEINPAYYCFDCKAMLEAIEKLTPDNAKGEYYLTDAVKILIEGGKKVGAVTAVEQDEAMAVNSRLQLSLVAKVMQRRIQAKLMADGVTLVDPDNTWIQAGAVIGQDTVVEPFVYIAGDVRIGRNCRIGPFACLRDVVIGDGQTVEMERERTSGKAGNYGGFEK